MVNCADHAKNFDNRGFHTDPEKDCVQMHKEIPYSFLPDVRAGVCIKKVALEVTYSL